jgi:hypothetical protein
MSDQALEINTDEDSIADVGVDDAAEDSAIGAIWDKHNDDDDWTNDNKVESKDGAETTKDASGRDESGRFASKDSPAAEDAAGEPAEGAAEATDTGAPAHLPYDIKSNWDTIPEAARDAIAALTSEQDRKFGELGRELASVKPIKETLSQYNEYFDGTKGNYRPEEAISYLFNVQRKMDQDPLNTIMEIAHTYGVADQLGQPTEGSHQVSQLHRTIRDLESRLQNTPAEIDQKIAQNFEMREFDKAIAEFASTADHYAEVEEKLPSFIAASWAIKGEGADKMDVLKHAYKLATDEIPEVRAKVQAAEKNKAAGHTDPKRTESAKRAASANVKSNSTGKSVTFTSEDEAMGAAYDRAMA